MSQTLEGARFISEHAKDVSINYEGVKNCAEKLQKALKRGDFKLSKWREHPLNPKIQDLKALEWIFIIDTLNFSFWHDDDLNPFEVEYKGIKYTGYLSLCAAINRALDENIPITSPTFLSNLTVENAAHIFRSSSITNIPLLQERVKVLNELGQVTIKQFEGKFEVLVNNANKSAQNFISCITSNFSSYNDISEFEGKEIRFFKRAQILVADIWACFEGKEYGEFKDIDTLTMFADYRVPQVLVFLNVLKYSEKLMKILNDKTLIQSKDKLEQEIRGCSIWSVEYLKQEIIKLNEKEGYQKEYELNCIVIDFYLWDYAKAHSNEMKQIPIHRTRSIYY